MLPALVKRTKLSSSNSRWHQQIQTQQRVKERQVQLLVARSDLTSQKSYGSPCRTLRCRGRAMLAVLWTIRSTSFVAVIARATCSSQLRNLKALKMHHPLPKLKHSTLKVKQRLWIHISKRLKRPVSSGKSFNWRISITMAPFSREYYHRSPS